jgi:hypothetical protein
MRCISFADCKCDCSKMPVQFTVDSSKRLVVCRVEGQITVRDLVGYFETLKGNPRFDSRFSELVDLTAVISSEVNYQSATMLASIDPFSHEARRAFAAPKSVVFGIIRMYQALREEESTIAVFESMSDAMRWLGIQV